MKLIPRGSRNLLTLSCRRNLDLFRSTNRHLCEISDSMTDAKATVCYLNGLALRTINEVEKILRGLPQKGNRCEVQITKPVSGECRRSTADVIVSKSMKIRDVVKPLALSPPADKEKNEKKKKKTEKPSRKFTDDESSRRSSSATDESDSSNSSSSSVVQKELKTPADKKFKCKVLTDQVRVSPIVACNGVILELDVEVTIPENGGEKKKLKLEIECPDFVPARIKIGNKWKKIV